MVAFSLFQRTLHCALGKAGGKRALSRLLRVLHELDERPVRGEIQRAVSRALSGGAG